MKLTWIQQLLVSLQDFLARFGVEEASRPIGALILLYLTVTILVLVFVLVAWRLTRSSSGGARPPDRPATPRAEPDRPATPSTRRAAPSEGADEELQPAPAESVLKRVRSGLGKTRETLLGRLDALFSHHPGFDSQLVEELEEILITSDFGMSTTTELINGLTRKFSGTDASPQDIYSALSEEIANRLRQAPGVASATSANGPYVIMMVGVNGVGKTTTIGKLAGQYVSRGKKVLLGAGDTFRAAAAEQLEIWSSRSGADIVRHQAGGDPAAVAYDAVKAAIARKADVLILDTAGRLHTKTNLMEELKKVCRVLGRELNGAPHETLLVVDATTGQNALAQARLFREAVPVDGIVLTKLDGTAKGGIVVAISSDLDIPVRYIGVGEAMEDLRPFDPELFVEALFGRGDDA